MSGIEPIASFDPKGKAAIISYNVAEPSAFSGRNYIELDFDDEVFESPPKSTTAPAKGKTETTKSAADKSLIIETVGELMDLSRFIDFNMDVEILNKGLRDFASLEPLLAAAKVNLREVNAGATRQEQVILTGSTFLAEPKVVVDYTKTPLAYLIEREGTAQIISAVQQGGQFVARTGLAGETILETRVFGDEPKPRIAIVEEYRLSSFLGSYGASKTLKTLTLLPGEEQRIKVSSSVKTSTKRSAGTSILDSYSQETGNEFTEQVEKENTTRKNSSENFSYNAKAEASASWGWGKAKVSGGVAGETNSSRENFGRNMSNATSKHISNASSERNVEIQTSEETSTESGFEETLERVIKNINLSRTMNFVFRSLVQEYITLLHLVDVRIAYHDTTADSYIEVPLSKLDELLAEKVKSGQRAEVKNTIVDALSHISDYQDELHSFVEQRDIKTDKKVIDSYLRVRKGLVSTYKDSTGNNISVPGIIISADKNTLKTQGVIVEALLGEGQALDEYSKGLQLNEVKRVDLNNQVIQAGLDILESGDAAKAEMFAAMFPQTQVLTDAVE